MAIGLEVTNASSTSGGSNVHTCSVTGQWLKVHDDARTAQTTANSVNVTAMAASVAHWTAIPSGCGKICQVRAYVPIATTAVGTSPIIQLFLGYGTLNSVGAPPTDGTFRFERLDNAVILATGLTLTFNANPNAATNNYNDATNFYSTSVLQSPTDLRGATHVLCQVLTAGACTATAIMAIEACFVN